MVKQEGESRSPDVVLTDGPLTKDHKKTFTVIEVGHIPPVVIARDHSGLNGQSKAKIDELGVVRPMRDSDVQSVDVL